MEKVFIKISLNNEISQQYLYWTWVQLFSGLSTHKAKKSRKNGTDCIDGNGDNAGGYGDGGGDGVDGDGDGDCVDGDGDGDGDGGGDCVDGGGGGGPKTARHPSKHEAKRAGSVSVHCDS